MRIVQYMYADNSGEVCGRSDRGEGFEVKVGLHQGSALSPCLFAMVMDRMTDEIREEAPWTTYMSTVPHSEGQSRVFIRCPAVPRNQQMSRIFRKWYYYFFRCRFFYMFASQRNKVTNFE